METLLQVENLSKSFGDLTLFDNISFGLLEGERVGLIGRNGCGKSTLLQIISGVEGHDSGHIVFRRDIRSAYLVQNPTFPDGSTVLEACFAGDSPALKAIATYERAIQSGDADAIHRASEQMDSLLAWDYEARAKDILTQLEITEFDKPTSQLSGGQAKRVALAAALICEPQLLVLDEPTNHLDMHVTLWLERYLAESHITLLMITHDRYFLDSVCNRIIEIEGRTLRSYKGNYAYYVERRQEVLSAEAATRESDRNTYRRELEWMRRMPQARGSKARYRVDSFKELEERLRSERTARELQLDIRSSRIGTKIFEMHHLCKHFGNRTILNDFSYIFQRYDHVGIVGDNGTGKSTFLKMLVGEAAPDSGTIDVGTTVRFGYYSQQGMTFDDNCRVIDTITAVAEHIELGDGRKLSASQLLQMFLFEPSQQYALVGRLSGGERRRLYLCRVLMQNPNFLILDEPTNDLDIPTLQVLEQYLESFSGCVIVVSHDRYFMDKVAEHLLVFEGAGVIHDFPSSYSDYVVWRRMRDAEQSSKVASSEPKSVEPHNAKPRPERLTFKEKRELESIEAELETLEQERKSLEQALSSGTLTADELTTDSTRIGEVLSRIDTLSDRWIELSDKA